MNRSSIDVMNRGMQCLMEKLGIVEAEQFIYLVKAEQLDYTKWQREHFDEMSKEEISSFLTRDLKIIVSGNKAWEINKLIETFMIIGEDINSYLMFNFVRNEDKENFKESLGKFWKERASFSEFVPEPFIIGNKSFYEKVLKDYLLNTTIEEIKDKKEKHNTQITPQDINKKKKKNL